MLALTTASGATGEAQQADSLATELENLKIRPDESDQVGTSVAVGFYEPESLLITFALCLLSVLHQSRCRVVLWRGYI